MTRKDKDKDLDATDTGLPGGGILDEEAPPPADKPGGPDAGSGPPPAEGPKGDEPSGGNSGGGQVGSGFDPIESPKPQDDDKKPQLVTPQSGQPVVAEDPRGDSPRRVNQAGFVTHAQAGVDHPNQPVQPTRYAFQMTEWLSLSEAERAKTPPPEPPEGQAPHPLAVQPKQDEVDQGKDLGRKHVVLK